MNPKPTVSQAYETLHTISSGLPDTIYIGRMGAIGHTASGQPPGAYLSCLTREPLGSRSISQDLRGEAHAGQYGQTAPEYWCHWARGGQRYRDPIRELSNPGTEFEQAQLDRLHRRTSPWRALKDLTT